MAKNVPTKILGSFLAEKKTARSFAEFVASDLGLLSTPPGTRTRNLRIKSPTL
jgi:hypothetical protein